MKQKLGIVIKITLSLLILSAAIYLFKNEFSPFKKKTVKESNLLPPKYAKARKLKIDFDGDKEKETLYIFEDKKIIDWILLDKNNKKIAGFGKPKPPLRPSIKIKAIKLNNNSNKQYLRWDQAVGPHQFETHLFTVIGKIFVPIFAKDEFNQTWHYPFYTSRGETDIFNLDKDSIKELIEYRDELPPDAPRLEDLELKELTIKTFSEQGNTNQSGEDAWTIVSRENEGKGRGKKVVWAAYSFVDEKIPYFIRLYNEEYDAIANPIVNALNEVFQKTEGVSKFMKYTDLTQDSIDFNLFVQQFWSRGWVYEFPIN
jgi:hypothetical protein